MKIEEIEIWKLIPYEFNNKIHDETQINRIANSIKEFWFLQPVVIDKNNIIIVWHGRVEGAKKLGLKKVPCIRAENLTETQIKKYRILDNKLNESAWDVDALKVELDELWDLNVWDIELKPDDLFGDILVNDEEDEDPEVKEDDAPKANSKAKILGGGELFILWNHRLICGDATKIEDIETLIDWKKMDIVYTDPPYWMFLDTDYSSMKSKLFKWKTWWKTYNKVKWDNEDFKPELIETIFDNFPDAKEVFIWGADYYPELLRWYKEWNFIIWDKRIEESTDKWWGSTFEIAWSKTKHKKEIARVKWFWLFWMEQEDTDKRVHPTQKPTKLAWWFLKKYSNEWDNVVDLYWWSWSTMIACEQLKRNCFMMELDPIYCEVIIKRFHQFNPEAEIKCLNRNLDLNVLRDENR